MNNPLKPLAVSHCPLPDHATHGARSRLNIFITNHYLILFLNSLSVMPWKSLAAVANRISRRS